MPNGNPESPFPVKGEDDLNEILKSAPIKEQSWLERLYTNVAAVLSLGFRLAWDRLDEIFIFKVQHSKKVATEYNERVALPLLRALVDAFRSSGLMDDRTAQIIENLKPDTPVVDIIYSLFVGGSLLKNYLQVAGQGMSGNLIQYLNKEYRPLLPDANAAVAAAFIAPEKTGEVREILKRSGLKDEHIDLLFIARYALYDLNTVRTLYLRKLLTKEKAFERMREMGFTDTRINEIMGTWEIIPPVNDILTMVAKEAFEPDQIQRYGLDLEFPSAQSDWLSKQGLSEFWQKKYWIAHWDYPSPQQVLYLLHRGLIEENEVSEYYRVVEMPKFWREKLIQASYIPFTRVDVRRMHKLGVLNDEELVKAYMDGGYDVEHAKKLAEFTKAYNAQGTTEISRSQVMRAYGNSFIDRESAAALLRLLKYSDNDIEWYLTNADYEEALDLQNLYMNATKTKYLDNLINDVDARTELAKLNLPGSRIEAIMAAWIATKQARAKLPSKTDLDKFLKADIITDDTYKSEMYKLGYSTQYTLWYLKVNQGK